MSAISEIVSRRYLLCQLASREIKARYKQSYLGIGWAVVQPLAMMAVFSIIFTKVLPVEIKGGYAYPVFVYSGLLSWGLFARSLTLLTDAMVSNADLIRKIYFPREVILLAGLAGRLVDFGIAFAVYVGLMIIFRVPPTVHFLWAAPVVLVVLALTLGVCLFTSALEVWRRDVRSVVALIAQVWFYATPIVYPLDRVPEQWRWVSRINPMTGAVEGFKSAVLYGQTPDLGLLGISAASALAVLLLGYLFFCRAERSFADVI
ncbi:MAG: ABC transporter permease [Planctomycetota bacterium]